MYIIRNASVAVWWFGLTAWMASSPHTFLCVVTALLLSGPILRHVRHPKSSVISPPLALSNYAAGCSVTWLGLAKAAIASGKMSSGGNVADRS